MNCYASIINCINRTTLYLLKKIMGSRIFLSVVSIIGPVAKPVMSYNERKSNI